MDWLFVEAVSKFKFKSGREPANLCAPCHLPVVPFIFWKASPCTLLCGAAV